MRLKALSPSAASLWSPIPGGITAPSGFKACGIKAGLKESNNPDLALLLAPDGAVCAGTFTQNLVRASCVDLCEQRLRATAGRARAVLVNSGQANACTGEQGLMDSLRATERLAVHLGLKADEVLMCSTGVIGVPIPMENLLSAIEHLVHDLSDTGGTSAAKAILTTDLVDKQIALAADLGGRQVRIGGMAKGSGMIHPNMATMLGFLTCDAGVSTEVWNSMIHRVVDASFNAITVDGDTSTNDTFLAFAHGEPLDDQYLDLLEVGLMSLLQHLAKAITRDGEGASSLFEVQVEGTASIAEARQIARTISSSSLVKTAIHGSDPNWGRIVAAAGRAGIYFSPSAVSLWLGPYQLMDKGTPIGFDKESASNYINQCLNSNNLMDKLVLIRLVVGSGDGIGTAWGCDLSEEYIHINADYTT